MSRHSLFRSLLLAGVAACAACAGPRVAPDLAWLPPSSGWVVRDVDERPTPQWVLYERDALEAEVKEIRIVGMVHAPPETTVRAIRQRLLDEAFVPEGLEREILESSAKEIVVYGRMSMPFPFTDREATERIRFDCDPRTGVHRVMSREIEPAQPPPDGVLRIPVARTRFLVAPSASGDSVLVIDTVHDLGGHFPNWVIYGPVADHLVKDLFTLREISAELDGASRRSRLAPPGPRYDPDAAGPCLASARARLRAHAPHFSSLARTLEATPGAPRCPPDMDPSAPFAAFEGRWTGRWAGAVVEHVWRTVAPGVQLVLLRDDGVARRGINLRLPDGRLCGLVVEPDGRERRHQGWFLPATAAGPAYLRWSTPDRDYFERVDCVGGAPVYQIRERLFDARGPRWGVQVRYRRPTPPRLAGS